MIILKEAQIMTFPNYNSPRQLSFACGSIAHGILIRNI